MSEATVKALTDRIRDALNESGILRELDNEQVYEAARVAAQTIEATGAIVAAIPEGYAKVYGHLVRLEPFGAQPTRAPIPIYFRIVEAVSS